MADTTTSPNMNLSVPVISVCPGPDWASDYNACLSVIDGHNHASGSGVAISQSGITLSAALPSYDSLTFNTSNAYALRSVRFTAQSAALALATDLGCIYESGVDLYYNDGSGNQIRLTQGGSIVGSAGSISGLPSGTASASFSAGSFIWQSATSTAAGMDNGPVTIRQQTASANGVTINSPNSLAANYAMYFPTGLPGAQNFLTLDASGNIAAPIALTGGIATANIANGAVTKPKLAALGQQVSSSCGTFSTASGSFVNVTNLAVTITTTGRPVRLLLLSDGSSAASYLAALANVNNNVSANFRIVRGSTEICQCEIQNAIGASGTLHLLIPVSSFNHVDVIGAGTYTYTVQALLASGAAAEVVNAVLMAYEL